MCHKIIKFFYQPGGFESFPAWSGDCGAELGDRYAICCRVFLEGLSQKEYLKGPSRQIVFAQKWFRWTRLGKDTKQRTFKFVKIFF